MERLYSKFKRGDVWYLQFDEENGDSIKDSSVQKKSRPYVIVSCEESNNSAPIFNVVPITTREFDHLPMHVYYRYYDSKNGDRHQIVLCEQITTVSIQVFNNSRSRYLYSFSLEFMNKIDEALARQLGLKPRVADMHVLERIVEELAEKQKKEIKEMKEKDSAARMEQLAVFLAKTFNIRLTAEDLLNGVQYRPEELQHASLETVQEMKETAKERTTKPRTPKEETAPEETVLEVDVQTDSREARKKRAKWSTEEKARFLDDYEKLSLAQMSKKYGIKKSSVSTNVCLFRREMRKNDA